MDYFCVEKELRWTEVGGEVELRVKGLVGAEC